VPSLEKGFKLEMVFSVTAPHSMLKIYRVPPPSPINAPFHSTLIPGFLSFASLETVLSNKGGKGRGT